MKGDFSRDTFDRKKHYISVLKQQGRLEVDADSNEQRAIDQNRTETEAIDVIGECGAPKYNGGFGITATDGQFRISTGRYYVDGILCENEEDVLYSEQPELPNPPDFIDLFSEADTEIGIIYLKVWKHHITALDDPQIREVALGGPDTSTRVKVIWQVKVLPISESLDELSCDTELSEWEDLIAPSTGTLNVRTAEPEGTDNNPCLIPPNAGYMRLENQLYRVEIHQGSDSNTGVTFKWSRDNGSVVTEIKKIDGQEVTVADLGPDDVLGFAKGQWIEIIDDALELNGQPGELLEIDDFSNDAEGRPVILLASAPTPLATGPDFPNGINPDYHPKLRRWDQSGIEATAMGLAVNTGPISLEGGIQVEFSSGTYKTGDYWLIPARTATGQIEWPMTNESSPVPIPQLPFGIEYHYCRLAIATYHDKTQTWNIEDCRPIFSSLSEPNLFYVGGDGQEAMPVPADSNQTPQPPQLPQPLQVRVARGAKPLGGAKVKFTIIEEGTGQLSKNEQTWESNSLDVETGDDGIAKCYWKLDPNTYSQQVKAELGDENNTLLPIYFSANLSVASQVAYEAGAGCTVLENTKTVQEALDKLCGVYQPHKLKVLAFGLAVGIGLALYVLVVCLLVSLPARGISFEGFPLRDLLCCIPQQNDFNPGVYGFNPDFNPGFCVIRAIINFLIGFGLGCLVAWCYNIIAFPISEQIK